MKIARRMGATQTGAEVVLVFPMMAGLSVAVSLIVPLGVLVGLYFLARVVRALERIADHHDRSLR